MAANPEKPSLSMHAAEPVGPRELAVPIMARKKAHKFPKSFKAFHSALLGSATIYESQEPSAAAFSEIILPPGPAEEASHFVCQSRHGQDDDDDDEDDSHGGKDDAGTIAGRSWAWFPREGQYDMFIGQ